MNWNEYWPNYIEKYSCVRHRPATTALHRTHCKKLSEFFGTIEIALISDALIEDYIAWRKQQKAFRKNTPVSNRTVNSELIVLAHALRWGMKRKWIDKLPFEEMQLLPESPVKEWHLDHMSRQQIMDAAQKYRQGMHYDLVMFFLISGLRRGEIRNLLWSDVDYTKNGVWIRDSKTKKAFFKLLPMIGIEILQRRARLRSFSCPHVFWNQETGNPFYDLYHMVKQVVRLAGLPDWSPHKLRHAYASHMGDKGANEFEIGAALNHQSTRCTKRYVHTHRARIQGHLREMEKDFQFQPFLDFTKKFDSNP